MAAVVGTTELFGPPHRELDLRVLEETHGALRRLRLLRRRQGPVLTTVRGRELAADPEALLRVLRTHVDAGELFDAAAWAATEAALLTRTEPVEVDELLDLVRTEVRSRAGAAPAAKCSTATSSSARSCRCLRAPRTSAC